MNRKRRDRINQWTPQTITSNNGHFFMYDKEKTFKDEYAQTRPDENDSISLVENISGRHQVSTNVVRKILSSP